MQRPVSAVTPDKLHVTLKFLGDTRMSQVEAIQQRIAAVVSSQPPFTVQVRRLGAFPSVQRPSVVWAGLDPGAPLIGLAEGLEAALEPLGFRREARPFHPHVTLARIKGRPPRALFDLLQQHAQTVFGSVEFRSVEFLRSILQTGGAQYSTLASFELGPSN